MTSTRRPPAGSRKHLPLSSVAALCLTIALAAPGAPGASDAAASEVTAVPSAPTEVASADAAMVEGDAAMIEGDEAVLASDLGSLLFTPPDVAPGGAPEGPVPDLSRLREHLDAGDLDRALRDAERIIEARWGRDRALASFVAGLIYRERGLHNLASESFTRVRLGGGPLANNRKMFDDSNSNKK